MKNLCVYCLMLSFCLLSLNTQAQEVEVVDVLHLRDGSIIEGNILKFIPKDIVVLETEDGVQFTYRVEDITKVVQARKGEVEELKKDKNRKPQHPPKDKGWYNITHAAIINGQTESDVHIGTSINNITGYLFERWLGVGIGFGIDNYVPGAGELVYPIFVEARGYIQPKAYSFYYSLQAGYGFAFANSDFLVTEAEGGLMYQPAIGYRIPTKDALQILVTLGARFQKASFERQDPFRGGEEILTLQYQRIMMGVGIQF